MRITTLLFCLFILLTTRAQLSSVGLGYLQTTYHFKAKEVLNSTDLSSSGGGAIDILVPTKNNIISYGLMYRQFNATGGNALKTYDWKTHYLGPQLLVTKENLTPNASIGLGLGVLGIIGGKQAIGGTILSLTKNEEFNGMWVSPSLHISYSIFNFSEATFKLNYQFSPTLKMGDQGDEKLYFTSNTIGLVIKMKTPEQIKKHQPKDSPNE